MKEKQRLEKCVKPEFSGLLAPYLNRNDTPEEARMLEDHLPECEECQEKLGLILMVSAHGLRGRRRGAKASPVRIGEVLPFRR